MEREEKQCQMCDSIFTIEPEDFEFYKKINVPPPTFCPDCRLQRRMIWRNERSLYKRKCDFCGESGISMYPEETPFPVYCPPCWRSDNWDPMEYGQDYDFDKPFFKQWKELFDKVPRQSLWHSGNNINAEYANFVLDSKNVYLAYSVVWGSEDVSYSSNIDNSKNIIDSWNVQEGEHLYENIQASKNYKCKYVYWSSDCINSMFMLDCSNCQDCFGCVNLRNEQYCIWNEKYSKEEYEQKLNELKTTSYKNLKELEKKFWEFSLKHPRKYSRVINSFNATGDDLRDSKNAHQVFNGYELEDVRFAYRAARIKDCTDICYCGANGELIYEHAIGGSDNSKGVFFVINSTEGLNDVYYIDSCKSSSDLFGCIGLQSKQYCIFNKQYSKEEYEELFSKIKEQMSEVLYIDQKGREYKYGEFFPAEFSTFGYNETMAHELFPLTQELALEKGFTWKEKEETHYEITKQADELPDDINDVDDSILDEVIACQRSGKAFKVIASELQFYRQMQIPLPRLHPDERYKDRIARRNPLKLYKRTTDDEIEVWTPYAPDRPEKILSDEGYKREVF